MKMLKLLRSALLISLTQHRAVAEIIEDSRPLSFSWVGNFSNDDISECDQIRFGLQFPAIYQSQGSPPAAVEARQITVRAYPSGGLPTYVTELEDDTGSFASWQVAIPRDTQLLVSLYDNANGQGGVQGIFKVIDPPSSTPTCSLPSRNNTDFKVVSNTSKPNACDPVSLTVTGGVKPYSLSFVVQDDLEYTALMGPNDDEYVWIANAVSNKVLLVSASDITGKLATSTGLFQVNNASTNASNSGCPGVKSFSRQSSTTSTTSTPVSNPTSNPEPVQKKTPVGAIVGGVVGGLVMVIVLVLLLRYWPRRFKSTGEQLEDDAKLNTSAADGGSTLNAQGNLQQLQGSQVIGNTVVGGVEPESMVQVLKPGLAILAPPGSGKSSAPPATSTSTHGEGFQSQGTSSHATPSQGIPAAQPSQPVLQEVDAGPAPPAYGKWEPSPGVDPT